MTWKRIFTTYYVKCTRNYLDSQKKFEIIRTILFFALPLALFFAGLITTGSRKNLLTVVAILGCLPACKSLVGMIMFLRYKSLPKNICDEIESHKKELACLYDCVFTSQDKTYTVGHIAIRGNTIAGLFMKDGQDEGACIKHLETYLKVDGFTNVTIKIFQDKKKYMERLDSLSELQEDEKLTQGILSTLKSVAL